MAIDTATVDLWRQKALAGTLSDDEARIAYQHLREDRMNASLRGKAKRDLAGPAKSGDELLDDFESM